MDSLPQSADELLQSLIRLLPEGMQPYAGFLFTLVVVIVGVLTFFQPVLELFKKKEAAPAKTGEAALDALLTRDARTQLTVALLARVNQPLAAANDQNSLESQSKRAVIERLVDAPSSPDKSERLAALLTDPENAISDMMEMARTAQDYVDIGILAMGYDAAKARLAFERARALELDNLDAAYYLLGQASLSEDTAKNMAGYEALLPRTERVRPDLTALILLKLARQANAEDRWEDALRQYRRAISIAEATHDMNRLAAACHASADDLLSFIRPLRKYDPDELPLSVLNEAEAMLAKAADSISKSPEPLPVEEINQSLGRANIAQIKNDFETATAWVKQAIEQARASGAKTAEARALGLLAIIQHKTFHLFAAIDTVDEAIALIARVVEGLDIDPDIPSAGLLRLKGDLLYANAQYDEALVYFERAYAAYIQSSGFDQFSQNELENAIFHCRTNSVEEFSEDEQLAAEGQLNTEDDNSDRTGIFDLEKRIQDAQLTLMAGKANPSSDNVCDGNDDQSSQSEPFFSAEEDEKLDKAASLYVSGKDRFENEDWENAKFALTRARELFYEIDALPADTENEIEDMLRVCVANGA